MNPYTAISHIDKTLVNLLWDNIKKDAQVNSIISAENQISLSSPKKFETDHLKKLSLFLYQIKVDPLMKNLPLTEQNKMSSLPIYLSLHYLASPNTNSTESDHILLGKVIQVFTSNPVLRDPFLSNDLRLTLESPSLRDLNDLWSIIGTPYRLAAFYSVSPVAIDA